MPSTPPVSLHCPCVLPSVWLVMTLLLRVASPFCQPDADAGLGEGGGQTVKYAPQGEDMLRPENEAGHSIQFTQFYPGSLMDRGDRAEMIRGSGIIRSPPNPDLSPLL